MEISGGKVRIKAYYRPLMKMGELLRTSLQGCLSARLSFLINKWDIYYNFKRIDSKSKNKDICLTFSVLPPEAKTYPGLMDMDLSVF